MAKKQKPMKTVVKSKVVEDLSEKSAKKRLAIGKRIRKLRKEHDLMQPELAEKLGWGQSKVSKIERGTIRLDLVEFLRMLEAMKCTKEDARYVLYGERRLEKRSRHSTEEPPEVSPS